MTVFLNTEITI